MTLPVLRVKRLAPDLFEATLVIPGGPHQQVHVKAVGVKKADAFARASEIAQGITENPVLAAVLPPGSGAAVQAVTHIAGAVASGKASEVASALGKYTGEGAKRLARWLHF